MHLVIHVSRLKPHRMDIPAEIEHVPDQLPTPYRILKHKFMQRQGRMRHKVLVEWEGPNQGTSWEEYEQVVHRFPIERAWAPPAPPSMASLSPWHVNASRRISQVRHLHHCPLPRADAPRLLLIPSAASLDRLGGSVFFFPFFDSSSATTATKKKWADSVVVVVAGPAAARGPRTGQLAQLEGLAKPTTDPSPNQGWVRAGLERALRVGSVKVKSRPDPKTLPDRAEYRAGLGTGTGHQKLGPARPPKTRSGFHEIGITVRNTVPTCLTILPASVLQRVPEETPLTGKSPGKKATGRAILKKTPWVRYRNPQKAQLLFGRGFRAGMDRREQKKLAVKNEKELREEIRRKEGVEEKPEDAAVQRKKEAATNLYDTLDMRVDRHWSEKKLEEMTERDWRIFREDFNKSVAGVRRVNLLSLPFPELFALLTHRSPSYRDGEGDRKGGRGRETRRGEGGIGKGEGEKGEGETGWGEGKRGGREGGRRDGMGEGGRETGRGENRRRGREMGRRAADGPGFSRAQPGPTPSLIFLFPFLSNLEQATTLQGSTKDLLEDSSSSS
ncbi:DEAD-box ATP-dependent RNA helicase 21 [Nymphaea thermarum]|nr:DEAD-box ATP-dependent RNA helicase 21 [Nymphaea thermarum]